MEILEKKVKKKLKLPNIEQLRAEIASLENDKTGLRCWLAHNGMLKNSCLYLEAQTALEAVKAI